MIERVSNEVFYGYNVGFDVYYSCTKNNIKCNLSHLYNLLKLFIFGYNAKIEKNLYSQLEVISLNLTSSLKIFYLIIGASGFLLIINCLV